MARTKKTTTTSEKTEEKTQSNNNLKDVGQIGYSGKLKVTIQKNGKVVETQKFHNSGSYRMFNFLAYCLKGDFTTVSNSRPRYVRAFYYPMEARSAVEIDNEIKKAIQNPQRENFPTGSSQTIPVSTILPAENADIVYTKGIRNETADTGVLGDNSKISYHFRIPSTYIYGEHINMFCLYSSDKADPTDYYACFLLYAINEETKYYYWTPINIEGTVENYNILLEWELTISNTQVA